MATDIKFVQKYNEVLLDNFHAVLKQNLLFQAQLAMAAEDAKVHDDYETIKADVAKLIQENTNLRNEIVAKNNEINSKNTIIQNNNNSDGERHRLQTALNKQSKDISVLDGKIKELEKTIDEQKEYIKQLEDMLPNSKKKKLGIAFVEEKAISVEQEEKSTPVNNDVVKVESVGGTF
jgi:predicted nuclease with TOPRIM domain